MNRPAYGQEKPTSARINVNREHELRYWASALKVDEQTLVAAVREVGPSAAAVLDHLEKRTVRRAAANRR
jgi:hypothetical protein